MSSKDFHESYAKNDEIEPPSERSTGLTFAAFATIVALLWRQSPTVPYIATLVAVGLLAISLTAPSGLKPLNIIWFKFGRLLHRLVSPIVMFAMFTLVFVPAGIIMRFWRDPLRSRRTTNSSYWIDCRSDSRNRQSMTDQF